MTISLPSIRADVPVRRHGSRQLNPAKPYSKQQENKRKPQTIPKNTEELLGSQSERLCNGKCWCLYNKGGQLKPGEDRHLIDSSRETHKVINEEGEEGVERAGRVKQDKTLEEGAFKK